MPQITKELVRKRAEHNEGLISTLEEISLHQEELEQINEILGINCRKLKILYLQNNIIPKIENLIHLKDLEYLNLALNNISKIEGLQNCEFLRKLDLTVNFIDLDELKSSVDHLVSRDRLRELYMMGNPAQVNWSGFESYIIAKLPQLQSLDGKEITKSMQIVARQKLEQLESELTILADQKKREKEEKEDSCDEEISTESVKDHEKLTENTPEVRVEIYKELAQQKKEKEDREKANQPKERNYDKEHSESVLAIRTKEESLDQSSIKQKNEGGWEFLWDDETQAGTIILEVKLPKFLDSSLIDVDIHPTYVSIIIKSKLLRLHIPSEVKVAESKCQRAKLTGSLKVVMPKVNSKEIILTSKPVEIKKKTTTVSSRTKIIGVKKLSLQEQMLQEVMQATTSTDETKQSFSSLTSLSSSNIVDIHNIVRKSPSNEENTLIQEHPISKVTIEEL